MNVLDLICECGHPVAQHFERNGCNVRVPAPKGFIDYCKCVLSRDEAQLGAQRLAAQAFLAELERTIEQENKSANFKNARDYGLQLLGAKKLLCALGLEVSE